jgi:hypothetical protein
MSYSARTILYLCACIMCLSLRCLGECPSCGARLPTSNTLCGPIAVQACLQYYKVQSTIDEIKALCGYTEESGTSIQGLCAAITKKGLYMRALKVDAKELLSSGLPFIAHYYYGHFAAVVPVDGGQSLRISDGTRTDRVYSRADFPMDRFLELYSGNAVVIADEEGKLPKSVAAESPDIRLNDQLWNLGILKYGDTNEHVFRIHNAGRSQLTLGTPEPSCDCLTALLSAKNVAPGGDVELHVTFNGTKEGSVQEIVKIRTNDPVVPVATAVAWGYVKPRTWVESPMRVWLPEPVARRAGAQTAVFLPQYPDNSIRITGTQSDSQFIKPLVEAVTEGDRRGYKLTIAVQPDAPVGELHGKVLVTSTHYAQDKVEIVVTAQITGDVRAQPEQLFFSPLHAGTKSRASVVVRTVGAGPLHITKIDNPLSYVSVDVKPKTEGKEYVLTATLKPDAPLGNIKGDITIHTNDPDQPEIKIPVYAYVEN